MRTCRNNLLCIIIALFLVLSGTVCEDTAADLSLSRASTSNQEDNSFIKSAHSVITDRQSCTEEVSGLRGNVSVRQLSSRLNGHGRKTGAHNGFQAVDNTYLKRYISLDICLKSDGYGNKYPEALITDYIHKSDGKKRIQSYHQLIMAC